MHALRAKFRVKLSTEEARLLGMLRKSKRALVVDLDVMWALRMVFSLDGL